MDSVVLVASIVAACSSLLVVIMQVRLQARIAGLKSELRTIGSNSQRSHDAQPSRRPQQQDRRQSKNQQREPQRSRPRQSEQAAQGGGKQSGNKQSGGNHDGGQAENTLRDLNLRLKNAERSQEQARREVREATSDALGEKANRDNNNNNKSRDNHRRSRRNRGRRPRPNNDQRQHFESDGTRGPYLYEQSDSQAGAPEPRETAVSPAHETKTERPSAEHHQAETTVERPRVEDNGHRKETTPPAPVQPAPEPRDEHRSESRDEHRSEPRDEHRSETRDEHRSETRNESRGEPANENRGGPEEKAPGEGMPQTVFGRR